MLAKLRVATMRKGDPGLAQTMLEAFQRNLVDSTRFFRRLSDAIEPGTGEEPGRDPFVDLTAADAVLDLWRPRKKSGCNHRVGSIQ